MVGFRETDDDFEQTLDLVRQVRFDSAYTFIYNTRQGTPASKWLNRFLKKIKDSGSKPGSGCKTDQPGKEQGVRGSTEEILVEGKKVKDELYLCGRNRGGKWSFPARRV